MGTPSIRKRVAAVSDGLMECMDELALHLGQCLERLLEENFTLPFHFAAISVNGMVLVGRYREDGNGSLTCDNLMEEVPDGKMMLLPINIMFTDARGEAARVVVEQNQLNGGTLRWIN